MFTLTGCKVRAAGSAVTLRGSRGIGRKRHARSWWLDDGVEVDARVVVELNRARCFEPADPSERVRQAAWQQEQHGCWERARGLAQHAVMVVVVEQQLLQWWRAAATGAAGRRAAPGAAEQRGAEQRQAAATSGSDGATRWARRRPRVRACAEAGGVGARQAVW